MDLFYKTLLYDNEVVKENVIVRNRMEMLITWLILVATRQSFPCVYHPDGEIATAQIAL